MRHGCVTLGKMARYIYRAQKVGQKEKDWHIIAFLKEKCILFMLSVRLGKGQVCWFLGFLWYR